MACPALLTSLSSAAPVVLEKFTVACCTEVNVKVCVTVWALAAGSRNAPVVPTVAAVPTDAMNTRSFMMTSVLLETLARRAANQPDELVDAAIVCPVRLAAAGWIRLTLRSRSVGCDLRVPGSFCVGGESGQQEGDRAHRQPDGRAAGVEGYRGDRAGDVDRTRGERRRRAPGAVPRAARRRRRCREVRGEGQAARTATGSLPPPVAVPMFMSEMSVGLRRPPSE